MPAATLTHLRLLARRVDLGRALTTLAKHHAQLMQKRGVGEGPEAQRVRTDLEQLRARLADTYWSSEAERR